MAGGAGGDPDFRREFWPFRRSNPDRAETASRTGTRRVDRIGRALLGLSRAGVILAVFALLTIWWRWWALAVALIVLWGIGGLWLTRSLAKPPQPVIKVISLVAASCVLFVTANITQTAYLANLYVLDVHELVQPWMLANLPIDGSILIGPDSMLKIAWNQSGEAKKLKLVSWDQITAVDLRQGNITYFLMSSDDRARYQADPSLTALFDHFTLVKTLPYPQNSGEPIFYIYRIAPPQQPLDVAFGQQIALVGYDLSSSWLSAGRPLTIRPYWRSLETPKTNYSMFIHLLAEGDDHPLAQFDGTPTTETQLTLTWTDPDALYVGRSVELEVPPTLKSGRYYLAIGLYDFSNGKRLTIADGSTTFRIPLSVGT